MKKLRHREQEVNPWNLNSGALAPAFQASRLPCAALQLRFCPSPMRPWAALPLAGVHTYQALPLLLVGQSGQHAEPCPQRSFAAVAIPCFRKHKSTAGPCLFPASGIPLGNSSGDLLPDGQTAGGKNSYENIILCVYVCVCVCARACVHALLVSPLHQCQAGSLAWPLQAYLPQGRLEVAEVTWSPLPFVSFEKQVEVMTRSSGWTGHRGQGEAEPALWWTNEVAQSCLTLCDPTDCSLPGSSIHGIFQARELKWVAISFSRKIFPTQGLNPGLPHCRQTLYCLSHQGSQESTVVGLRYVCKVGVGVAPATHFLFQGKLSFNGMIL